MFLELGLIDSTNEEAKRHIDKGVVCHGSVIWARQQTAGKGRLGRVWESPNVGNVYFSMIIEPDYARASLPQYSPFMACVLVSVISWYFDNPSEVQYKWPNDILISGKKVGGILLELYGAGKNQRLIIGIGINVETAPRKTFFPATSMREEGITDANDLNIINRILSEYDVWWQFWHDKGFPLLIKELKKSLYGVGKMVRVQFTPDKSIDGICRGIDDNGFLLLEDNQGQIKTYHAGDVFML